MNYINQDEQTLSKYLLIAEEAAIQAGNYLATHHSHVSIRSSQGKDVKISADKESEKIIIDTLMESSKTPILSEESGFSKGGAPIPSPIWIVDPLDGSLNYLRGIPVCCVSIGLWDGFTPLLGAIYDFNTKDLFKGIATKGAWLNNNQIRVSNAKALNESLLFTGFPVGTDFSSTALHRYIEQIRAFRKVRLMGSAALSLAYVASGRGEVYFERDIMIWDIAAGLAILSGAGGMFEIEATAKENACIALGTNGSLDQVLLADIGLRSSGMTGGFRIGGPTL